MTELDRAYVINGSDLAIEVRRLHGTPADAWTRKFLERDGRPLDELPGVRVEVWHLADWLKNHVVTVNSGLVATGHVQHPEALAETILEDITGKGLPEGDTERRPPEIRQGEHPLRWIVVRNQIAAWLRNHPVTVIDGERRMVADPFGLAVVIADYVFTHRPEDVPADGDVVDAAIHNAGCTDTSCDGSCDDEPDAWGVGPAAADLEDATARQFRAMEQIGRILAGLPNDIERRAVSEAALVWARIGLAPF